jgi:hypothetical protein
VSNIISIDPSLTSTAVVIKSNNKYKYFSFFKDFNEKNKWCKPLLPFVQFEKVNFINTDNFSDNEILKLIQYEDLALRIVYALKNYLNQDTIIKIESYSQQSKNGKYQDLITFGTLLRYYLYKKTKKLHFFPPKEVKKKTAELVYGVDKKGIARNFEKKAGGNFNKWDMFYTLVDRKDNSELSKYCIDNLEEIKKNKSVPKPLEDLIDAYFLNLIE